MASVDRAGLISLMVGRTVETIFPKRDVRPGPVRFAACNLGSKSAGVHEISFQVHAGEILGLAGLVGAGRTELARVLFGVEPADCGTMTFDGKPFAPTTPTEALRVGMAYVPEDRRRHGIIGALSVAANTGLSRLRGMRLDRRGEAQVAQDFVARLGTKTPTVDTPVGNLSGGNQQKVALARLLATNPRMLVLDEPTQGIDVGAKSEIHSLIGQLAEQGLAVILISSELPELLGLCDRIGVMRAGHLVGLMPREQATSEALLDLMLGDRKAGDAA